MKISEYILALKALKAEHGDLEVHEWWFGGEKMANTPEIDYLCILNKRESKARFYMNHEPIDKRGEKVVRI